MPITKALSFGAPQDYRYGWLRSRAIATAAVNTTPRHFLLYFAQDTAPRPMMIIFLPDRDAA